MKKIFPLVQESNIPFRLILDFDILIDSDELSIILNLFEIEENIKSQIIDSWKGFLKLINGKSNEELKKDIVNELSNIVNRNDSDTITLTTLKKRVEAIIGSSKFKVIKNRGIIAFEGKKENYV